MISVPRLRLLFTPACVVWCERKYPLDLSTGLRLSSVCAPCAGLNRGGRAAVYVGCAPRGGAFSRVDEDLREWYLVRVKGEGKG